MIELATAALLAMIGLGIGRCLLDRLGQTPEHPLDAAALSLPLGLGLLALGVLALGELGWLNRAGISILLVGLGLTSILPALRSLRELRRLMQRADADRSMTAIDRLGALLVGLTLLGTATVALGPVTDGDALCYHLQVPKVFLLAGAVRFEPDLHETVYPLLTEALYAVALALRGPIACRWVHFFLGLTLAVSVSAMARPSLGRRAWWAGAIILLAPAISNGMSAPLNDVALAAFGSAAILAWSRLLDRPGRSAAVVAGLLGGLAIGVKYPALVMVGLMGGWLWFRAARDTIQGFRRPCGNVGADLAAIYTAAVLTAGGWWYLRAFVHTGNPVYPFFPAVFGGSGLEEVLDAIKRPMAVTPWNLATSLVPLTLQPDRFDSFSHQFGPIFLLFLPALLLRPPPRRVLETAAVGYLFLMLCLMFRQSMRFLLITLGPLSVAVAHGFSICRDRRTWPSRLLVMILVGTLGLEAGLALARARHLAGVLAGRESLDSLLARREPTYVVGRWTDEHLPATARVIGQDHRGFYIPRPYTMELAHRRRTGLGRHGERPEDIVDVLRARGFTHLLLCPPVAPGSVEFDPTLGRLLAPWLASREPVYRQELGDGDGVIRRYAIYELQDARLASRPAGDPSR